MKSAKHLGNHIDFIAMAFNSPILDLPNLCSYNNFLNMIAFVTVRPSVVRTAGPTANIGGVPVIVE